MHKILEWLVIDILLIKNIYCCSILFLEWGNIAQFLQNRWFCIPHAVIYKLAKASVFVTTKTWPLATASHSPNRSGQRAISNSDWSFPKCICEISGLKFKQSSCLTRLIYLSLWTQHPHLEQHLFHPWAHTLNKAKVGQILFQALHLSIFQQSQQCLQDISLPKWFFSVNCWCYNYLCQR